MTELIKAYEELSNYLVNNCISCKDYVEKQTTKIVNLELEQRRRIK